MAAEVSQREALIHLGGSTAEAVARVLEQIVSGQVERGDVSVVGEDLSPFANLPLGGIAASVRYIDGVTGANVFLMPVACARGLAAAMGVPATDEGPLSELEMSAIGEAANQMLAAAAGAISVVIGQEIQISPPDVRVLDGRPDMADSWGSAPFACSTSFVIAGEPCRLVQLVPSAFVVRMARAIDELIVDQTELPDVSGSGGSDEHPHGVPITDTLNQVNLRVWAELGRAQISLGSALELPVGAVLDLDHAADAPVDLFVNGLCFGQGQLLVTDDGEWAIEVKTLTKPSVRRPALTGGAGVTTQEPH